MKMLSFSTPQYAASTSVDFLHAVLTVDRHEVFGFDQAQHELLFLLATVSRGMDIVNLTVDDIDSCFRDDVDQAVDASCVARNWTRGEDNGITRLQLYLAVGSISDTR